MISVKYTLILAVGFVAGASIFASPVPQAIAAVIATDVQCTGCVGSADIASSAVTTTKLASNSVNGGKVTDQSLSAADLGADSVGASELKGVTKLIFAHCELTTDEATFVYTPADFDGIDCSITGVDSSDTALATLDNSNPCFHVESVSPESNNVQVTVKNGCSTSQTIGLSSFIGIIVFDK